MTIYNKLAQTMKNSTTALRGVKAIVGSVIVVSAMIVGGNANAATPFSGAGNVGSNVESALVQTAGFHKPGLIKVGFKRHHKRNFGFRGHRGFRKGFGHGNKFYRGGFKHHSYKSKKYFGHGFGHGFGHKSKKFFGKGHRRGFGGGSRGFGFRGRRG